MFEPVLQSEPIPLRLWHEFSFAIKEFRDNPTVFVREAFRDERQKDSKRLLALAAIFTFFAYSIFVTLLFVFDVTRAIQKTEDIKQENVVFVTSGAVEQPLPPASTKGKDGGGASGGGQKADTPASKGQSPLTSTVPPIVHPDPRQSPVTAPPLPVAATIQDMTNPVTAQIPNVPVGIQNAPVGLPPSPGTGDGGGLGNGHGPGVGNGTGPGNKPGGKAGGGNGPDNNGPGGGVGNNLNGPRVGSNVINSRVKVYYMPEPHYTPEALKNGIAGRVIVYVRCHADGTVSNPRVLTPLGYGLDEEAIRIAMLIKFYPKMENGRPVDDTIDLTIPFRLTGKRP